MSNWKNENGEPYMTSAELAFEAEIDNASSYDYDPYEEDDYPYGFDEGECEDYV